MGDYFLDKLPLASVLVLCIPSQTLSLGQCIAILLADAGGFFFSPTLSPKTSNHRPTIFPLAAAFPASWSDRVEWVLRYILGLLNSVDDLLIYI